MKHFYFHSLSDLLIYRFHLDPLFIAFSLEEVVRVCFTLFFTQNLCLRNFPWHQTSCNLLKITVGICWRLIYIYITGLNIDNINGCYLKLLIDFLTHLLFSLELRSRSRPFFLIWLWFILESWFPRNFEWLRRVVNDTRSHLDLLRRLYSYGLFLQDLR